MDIERLQVPITNLVTSGLNTRKTPKDRDLAELAQSVELHGILQPIIVRPKPPNFEVICGNRRWKAALLAKKEVVPVDVHYGMDDETARHFILIENIQREDEHPMDVATGLNYLSQTYPDVNVLSARVGKDPRWVKRIMQLLALIPSARKRYRDGDMNLGVAFEIARLPDPAAQEEILGWYQEGTSLQALRNWIQRRFYLKLAKAPFPTDDIELVPAAGSCMVCPKRSGANMLLFEDLSEDDICTDAGCYDNKVKAFVARARSQWEEKNPGQKLVALSGIWGGTQGEALPQNKWEAIPAKAAKGDPKVRYGVVEQGDNKDIGKVVAFVTPESGSAEKPLTKAQKINTFHQRDQINEVKQNTDKGITAVPVVMAAVRRSQALSEQECQFLAVDLTRVLDHETLMRVCKALKLEVAENQYKIKDFHAAVEAVGTKIRTTKDLAFWMLELFLCRYARSGPEVEFVYRASDLKNSVLLDEGNPLYAIAKRRKIDLAAAFTPIAEKYKEKRQRSLKRLGLAVDDLKPKEEVKKATRPKKSHPKAAK